MEYFDLGDLRKCVTAPLPEPECQTIVYQVAEALKFMHERNFAHRDLKPSVCCYAAYNSSWLTVKEHICCSSWPILVGQDC